MLLLSLYRFLREYVAYRVRHAVYGASASARFVQLAAVYDLRDEGFAVSLQSLPQSRIRASCLQAVPVMRRPNQYS
ncbi:MAG TPA: hypothetical protein VLA51_09305, partial [Paracoccaceae bacterium]|nr:hypothetical protein [Paracoccaceae bacterium]